MRNFFLLLFVFSVFFMGKGMSQTAVLGKDSLLVIQEGIASFYGKRFHKRRAASGEIFDMNDHTAAHKHLPFGTMLKVINLNNGYEVIVRINDRLPRNSKRIIDLSKAAAEQLDMIEMGLAPVKLQVLSFDVIKKLKRYYKVVPDELRLREYAEPVSLAAGRGVFFSNMLFKKRIKLAGIYTIN